MSILRFNGMYTPVCDICGFEMLYADSFGEAVEAKRDAGWVTVRDASGHREDVCSVCQRGGVEQL